MNGLQVVDLDVRIDLRRLKRCVPEQLLDVADVRAALQHVRRARVTQPVRPHRFVDVRSFEMATHDRDDELGVERQTAPRDEAFQKS